MWICPRRVLAARPIDDIPHWDRGDVTCDANHDKTWIGGYNTAISPIGGGLVQIGLVQMTPQSKWGWTDH